MSTDTDPLGSAVNRRDDRAIAARRAITQEDRVAETLLIRENMLCIGRTWANYLRSLEEKKFYNFESKRDTTTAAMQPRWHSLARALGICQQPALTYSEIFGFTFERSLTNDESLRSDSWPPLTPPVSPLPQWSTEKTEDLVFGEFRCN